MIKKGTCIFYTTRFSPYSKLVVKNVQYRVPGTRTTLKIKKQNKVHVPAEIHDIPVFFFYMLIQYVPGVLH